MGDEGSHDLLVFPTQRNDNGFSSETAEDEANVAALSRHLLEFT